MDKSLKLIIFDCDGTLVDSQHMIVAAMERAYGGLGLAMPAREKLISIVGLSLSEAFQHLCDHDSDFPVAKMVERYKAAFFELRAGGDHVEALYPGAREAIESLSGNPDVLLGIATGKSQRGVAAVLGHHGLLDRFAIIKTSDDAPSKPHPAMVLDAMRATGAAPADTVMIGDTVFDITMARAAGTAGIGVGWGYHPPAALAEAGAHTVIDEFPALMPVLDGLWARVKSTPAAAPVK
jgi:phosphoglycolate phosphatase